MMKAERERIAVIARRIDILNDEGNKKLKYAYTLVSLQTKLCAEVITGERLLAGKWRSIPDNHVVRLVATWFDYQRIRELVKPLLIYDDIKLTVVEGVTLSVGDDSLTLWLTVETAAQFILENGITLDMASVFENRDKLATRLEETNAMIAALGETP
jgi:hypothetical protein